MEHFSKIDLARLLVRLKKYKYSETQYYLKNNTEVLKEFHQNNTLKNIQLTDGLIEKVKTQLLKNQ